MPNVIEKTVNNIKSKFSANPADAPKNSSDPIPVGVTNLTVGATFTALFALVVELFTDWSKILIGEDAGPGTRAALAIAFIAAIAIVYGTDLLARGYASAHTSRVAADAGSGPPETVAEVSIDTTPIDISIPGLSDGEGGEKGWRIIHFDGDRVLVIKPGKPPKWWAIGDVRGA